jgi:hypothetical protein
MACHVESCIFPNIMCPTVGIGIIKKKKGMQALFVSFFLLHYIRTVQKKKKKEKEKETHHNNDKTIPGFT